MFKSINLDTKIVEIVTEAASKPKRLIDNQSAIKIIK